MENLLEILGSRFKLAEERISEFEYRSKKIRQSEGQRKKKHEKNG